MKTADFHKKLERGIKRVEDRLKKKGLIRETPAKVSQKNQKTK